MKCVCGYEYETENYGLDVVKGYEPFSKLEPSLFRIGKEYESYSVDLYACPKCSTIRIG